MRRSGHPPLNLARERKRRKTAACSRAEFGTRERPIRYPGSAPSGEVRGLRIVPVTGHSPQGRFV
ncbi:hypothetical protein [Paenibacillus durus]|uniref:hypothetical protein n=1 Tax=Paenibacillus durus TaxID=44251 RepID=UPI0012E01108|nr:hypothetical protein [Paenibacillus durus]